MSEFKGMETPYKGHRFRSRLEARWAVAFDALGVKWLYEPQNKRFGSVGYVPDFYLPQQAAWIEIKGEFAGAAKHEALWKAHRLAEHDSRRVLVAFGDIPHPHPNDGDESAIHVLPDGSESSGFFWCVCPWCGRLDLTAGGDAGRLDCDCATSHGHCGNVDAYDAPIIQAAYAAGRSARFEHGESGAPHPTPKRGGPNPDDRAFLDRFPQNARGTLANKFLAPIRDGVVNPQAVIVAVRAECVRTVQQTWRYRDQSWSGEVAQRETRILDLITSYPDEASRLAQYYIAYESLPRGERDRLKARGHAALSSERSTVDIAAEQEAWSRAMRGAHR